MDAELKVLMIRRRHQDNHASAVAIVVSVAWTMVLGNMLPTDLEYRAQHDVRVRETCIASVRMQCRREMLTNMDPEPERQGRLPTSRVEEYVELRWRLC